MPEVGLSEGSGILLSLCDDWLGIGAGILEQELRGVGGSLGVEIGTSGGGLLDQGMELLSCYTSG